MKRGYNGVIVSSQQYDLSTISGISAALNLRFNQIFEDMWSVTGTIRREDAWTYLVESSDWEVQQALLKLSDNEQHRIRNRIIRWGSYTA